MTTRTKLTGDSVSRALSEGWLRGMSALLMPKFHTPSRKIATQHKPDCFPKRFRHSEPFLKNGGNPLKIQMPSRTNSASRPF